MKIYENNILLQFLHMIVEEHCLKQNVGNDSRRDWKKPQSNQNHNKGLSRLLNIMVYYAIT